MPVMALCLLFPHCLNEHAQCIDLTPVLFISPLCYQYMLGVYVCVCVCVCVCSVVSDSTTPWTVAHQAPLSMGFSRQ